MMKLLSSEWIAAERENKAIRDAERKKFWKAVSVRPARGIVEVDVAPTARIGRMQELINKTTSGKENDADLAIITQLAGSVLSDCALGSFSHNEISFGLDETKLSPKALRAFFLSDDLTSREVAEIR